MSRISIFCGLLLLFPLSSCGGGGSSPAKPAATPTPTPINRSCNAQTYRPNYSATPNFKLMRWPVFPLRVFFVADAQNTAARRDLAVNGFDKWVKATDDGVNYRVVSRPSDANITVRFYQYQGGPGDVLGRTNIQVFDGSNTLSSAAITIGITGDNRNDGITATHEFGHALGLEGHSRDADDLMFFEGNDERCGCLTPADVNTILTAYCGEFNNNANARIAPHRGKLRTFTIE